MNYDHLAASAARTRKSVATSDRATISNRLAAMRPPDSVSGTAATSKTPTRATPAAKVAARKPTGPSADFVAGFMAARSRIKAALASDVIKGQERAAMDLLAAGKTVAEIEAALGPAVWDTVIADLDRERGQA